MNCTRLKRAAEHVGERAHGQRLGEARHAFEQHVAAGEQRDEDALEHGVLADDDALALPERRLQCAAALGRDVDLGLGGRHERWGPGVDVVHAAEATAAPVTCP